MPTFSRNLEQSLHRALALGHRPFTERDLLERGGLEGGTRRQQPHQED